MRLMWREALPVAAVAQGSSLTMGRAGWVSVSFAGELPGWVLAMQGTSLLCLGQKADGRPQQDPPDIAIPMAVSEQLLGGLGPTATSVNTEHILVRT